MAAPKALNASLPPFLFPFLLSSCLPSPSWSPPPLPSVFSGTGWPIKARCIEPRVQPHLESRLGTLLSLPLLQPASRYWLLLFIQHNDLRTLLLEFRSPSCSALSLQANNGDLYPNQRTKIKAVDRIVCISCFPPCVFFLKLSTSTGILCKTASGLAQFYI